MDTVNGIAADLRALGVREGDTILVHSSLKSLGHVPGGPLEVVLGLVEALGPSGTLLFPSLSYAFVGRHQVVFDVLNTPSCIGAIPEFFRTFARQERLGNGTFMRSIHPTHSVCGCGAKAQAILGEHYRATTPCGGPHSPFTKLRDCGGKILMLGCGLRPNTSMHAVEELVEPPYLLREPVDYRIILPDGREMAMRVRQHDFDGWVQRYDRVADVLAEPQLRTGPVLSATAHLIDAQAMWQAGEAALRRNPLFFVDREKKAAT